MPQISVIVPVYKAEKYIHRCVDSILAQAFTDFELILVDDGSPDGCGAICDEYAAKDSRIRVTHQANGGVSRARNTGIGQAKGRIVLFIDSDDFVVDEYFQEIANVFSKKQADVVFFEFNRVSEAGEIVSHHKLPENIDGFGFYKKAMALSETDMFGYTWLKAIRKEVLELVRFDENMSLFEDEVFTCAVLNTTTQLAFIHKPLYNYVCMNGESLARKTHEDYCLLCEKVYCAWKNLLRNCCEEKEEFLRKKALHMQNVCKFYGMERDVVTISFYKELSDCSFVKEHENGDKLIELIRKKRWIRILRYLICCCFKRNIAKLINKIKG